MLVLPLNDVDVEMESSGTPDFIAEGQGGHAIDILVAVVDGVPDQTDDVMEGDKEQEASDLRGRMALHGFSTTVQPRRMRPPAPPIPAICAVDKLPMVIIVKEKSDEQMAHTEQETTVTEPVPEAAATAPSSSAHMGDDHVDATRQPDAAPASQDKSAYQYAEHVGSPEQAQTEDPRKQAG